MADPEEELRRMQEQVDKTLKSFGADMDWGGKLTGNYRRGQPLKVAQLSALSENDIVWVITKKATDQGYRANSPHVYKGMHDGDYIFADGSFALEFTNESASGNCVDYHDGWGKTVLFVAIPLN